ncbi:hypothetical protein AADZ91_00810 [Colwelliaceae bacterium 6441]
MNIDTYDDVDIDLNFETGIAGFEIAYGSINKKAMRRTVKYKQQLKDKLDSLSEKRMLDKQLNSLSDYWDM